MPVDTNASLWAVGNGGFTLRKVSDCLRVLNTFAIARPWKQVMQEHTPNLKLSSIRKIYLISRYLLFKNNTHWLANDFHRYRQFYQEDYFWGVLCKEKFTWYKVPSPQQALAFSFEVAPSQMYSLNNCQLPVGCHAWEKYEPEFWAPFIAESVAKKTF